ncbi:response regulator [Lysinibacillus odysseyi]|uniref:response regulator n=1 Tax=Lysinibacillus odysseyi TaxID=202611 RepID=UPI00068D61F9|nr:response regulator [Lysinibacillus odysseyi]
MLKAVIVDDEMLVSNFLKIQLESTGLATVIDQFQKPSTALSEIPNLKPDVVFLDIEMPGMNGIELGTKLLNTCIGLEIIFVTAYNQYAVDAFKLNAIHYLLKPADEEDLRIALERVIEKRKAYSDIVLNNNLRIELLGHIKIFQNSQEVRLKWPTVKVEELFALMLMCRNHGIEKWQLTEKLWPSIELKKAEQNLYTTIYRLKKILLESGLDVRIKNAKGKYFLELSNCTIDIDEQRQFNKAVLFGDKQYSWVEGLNI